MRVINWDGYEIRFINKDGEWWAVLKDFIEAFHFDKNTIRRKVEPSAISKAKVISDRYMPEKYETYGNTAYHNFERPYSMLIINEIGIYEALLLSLYHPESENFVGWTARVLQKIRKAKGIKDYHILMMLDPDIQKEILNESTKV